MPSPNLQLVAAHVVRNVVDQGRSLDRTIEHESKRLRNEQHAQLRETAYGGVRHYSYFDGVLGVLLEKPIRRKDRMVHFLLVIGMYQIRYMRTPDHAAVNQTVGALAASKQSWARGLVNGVLRNFLRIVKNNGLGEIEKKLSNAQRMAFPEFIYQSVRTSWPDQADSIFTASNQKPPFVLRTNKQKTTRQNYLSLLESHDIAATPTAESDYGIVLDQPRAVEALPMFQEGWVSVQDESAQLCTQQMLLEPGMTVLDGCAAPGGKACAMLEAEPDIRLTAVDLPERVEAIEQNLVRLGLTANIRDMGLEEYGDWWDGEPWDRILLDVPCSGSGVIRRHPDIRHRRQPGDLARFASQQFTLLQTAWDMLARGGRLLYVTCSIFDEENDDVIDAFLKQTEDADNDPVSLGGEVTRQGIQRLPGVHQGDGFYYCRLVKL